jgi:hypothetical protein
METMKLFKNILIYSILLIFATTSCHRSEGQKSGKGIDILRYEQVLFDTPTDKLPNAMLDFQTKFNSPLLNIYPDDAQFMAQVTGFVSDNTVRDIYNITQRHYRDLRWLEKELDAALQKAQALDAGIDINKFATFVSGYFDYSQRILADRNSKSLIVSIDQYAVSDMEKYSFFGLPLYIVELSDSIFLASDIMAEIARQYITVPDEKEITMLDLMVSEGKVLYFLDQVMPKKDDRLKIRYSEEQMDWMRENEGRIWAYFIQNELLYEKDYNRYHNFVDEAPKTNAFKDSSPRTTQYIGWQIVRKYMENSKSTLKDLFANTNSQEILTVSKYKP